MSPTWTSLHMFTHLPVPAVDELLLDEVDPAVAELMHEGACDGWFFVRYWAGGPHVRLRLRSLDDETRTAQLAQRLEDAVARRTGSAVRPDEFYAGLGLDGVAHHGWREHGEVVRQVYEPEVERYGGEHALGLAEELFVASTSGALAALRAIRNADPGARPSLALNLLLAFVDGVCETDAAKVSLLRRYVLTARRNGEGPAVHVGAIVDSAESAFLKAPERYRRLAEQVRSRLSRGSDTDLLVTWRDLARDHANRLRDLESAGRLARTTSPWTVLLSQLHMFHNRLGLSLDAEYRLCWLLSLALLPVDLSEPYQAGGLDRSSRRYHESSKYRRDLIGDQLPDAWAVPAPGTAWPPDREIRLSPPHTATPVHPGLLATLAGRRSGVAPLGPVPEAQVSAVLHAAAAERPRLVSLPGGQLVETGVRPHPSAGGARPTRVLVWPTDVRSLDPDLYSYDGREHVLRRVRPRPSISELTSASPYLADGAGATVDAASVPLWIFVVGDVASIERRYGLRGYRFLLMEVGHLAQNLLLLATAFGLGATPIGAFYDDALSQFLDVDGVAEAPFYVIPVGGAVAGTSETPDAGAVGR